VDGGICCRGPIVETEEARNVLLAFDLLNFAATKLPHTTIISGNTQSITIVFPAKRRADFSIEGSRTGSIVGILIGD
jgi:hypothetical protein